MGRADVLEVHYLFMAPVHRKFSFVIAVSPSQHNYYVVHQLKLLLSLNSPFDVLIRNAFIDSAYHLLKWWQLFVTIRWWTPQLNAALPVWLLWLCPSCSFWSSWLTREFPDSFRWLSGCCIMESKTIAHEITWSRSSVNILVRIERINSSWPITVS